MKCLLQMYSVDSAEDISGRLARQEQVRMLGAQVRFMATDICNSLESISA